MDCRNSIRVSGNLAGDLQKALNDHDAANSIRCFLIKPDCTYDLCVRDELLGQIGGDAGLIMPSKPFSALLFIHQREVGLGAFNYLLPEARRIAQFIKAYRKKKTDFNIRVYGEVLKAQLSESSIIQRLPVRCVSPGNRTSIRADDYRDRLSAIAILGMKSGDTQTSVTTVLGFTISGVWTPPVA
jgi:hypothetical protein